MWTNQTIFSIGDMCGTLEKEYNQFIDEKYNGSLQERLEHVERMITRLEFERKKLKEKIV